MEWPFLQWTTISLHCVWLCAEPFGAEQLQCAVLDEHTHLRHRPFNACRQICLLVETFRQENQLHFDRNQKNFCYAWYRREIHNHFSKMTHDDDHLTRNQGGTVRVVGVDASCQRHKDLQPLFHAVVLYYQMQLSIVVFVVLTFTLSSYIVDNSLFPLFRF